MSRVRPTPKVFQSNYRPPKSFDWSAYRSLKPLLWVLALILGLWLLSRLPIFTITQIELIGTDDPGVATSLNTLKGHSIFSRFVTETTDQLKAKNLTFESLVCSRGIPHTLRCSVVLRTASIGWQRGENQFVADSNGLIFATRTDRFPVDLTIDDRGTSPVEIGKTVVSSEAITAYKTISNQLKASSFLVQGMFINESLYQVGVILAGNKAEDIKWQPGQNVTALLVTNYPIDSQIKEIVEAVKTQKTSIKTQIDVRVPGYLYLK